MPKSKKASPPVVVPVVLASLLGFVVSFGAGTKKLIPLSDAEMRTELHLYIDLLEGEKPPLTESAYEALTAREWHRSIALEPYECVMLGMSAAASEFSLRLHVPSIDRFDVRNALSFCAEGEATQAEFSANFESPPGRIYIEEYQGPIGDLNQYTIAANYLDETYLRERWPRELRQRSEQAQGQPSGELLSGPHRIDASNAALLIPHDEQMMRVVHESSFLGLAEVEPVDFRVRNQEGEVVGSVAPSVRVDGALQPLIVAIDPRQNDFCTLVEVWPTHAGNQNIGTVTHPGAVVRANAGNRMEVCPESGVTLIYATPSQYDVHLYRGREAEAQPRTHVSMTISQALRDYLAQCEHGGADACQRAATRYHQGMGTRPDLEKAGELFERACELGAQHCLEAASFAHGARQHRMLLRACNEGRVANACEVLGARFRVGEGVAVNYAFARAAYLRACGLGGDGAGGCSEAQNMLRLELASADEDAAATTALGFN